MRYIVLLFCTVLTLLSCQKNAPTDQGTIQSSSFEWLIDDWIRINGDVGATTYESWTRESEDLYMGSGYTIVGRDTVSGESIQLIRKDQQWQLEVTSFGESTPTIFPLTESRDKSFTCTHPTLEFPNRIYYQREGELLKATVSGVDIELEFVFQPVTGE